MALILCYEQYIQLRTFDTYIYILLIEVYVYKRNSHSE